MRGRGAQAGRGGAASDSALAAAVVGTVRDADILTLKRTLVVMEKARREAEQRAVGQVQQAQAQVRRGVDR